MAKKTNKSPNEIDITTWDWVGEAVPGIPPCASCHPGGGPLELDRDGNRYDEWLAAHPDLRAEPDGDYYQSNWDVSGVVEADCLLCHSPTYDWNARIDQLAARNYRWAATAGAQLGTVTGKVAAGETPTVVYNNRLFNHDGWAVLDIWAQPADDNCVQCHGPSDLKKRGFSWFDPENPDVHNQQGVRCIDCHPAGLDHQIAKGDTTIESVRDDLDNTMRSCAGCHSVGYRGATIPNHLNVPPSHLEELACETCHIPYKGRTPGQVFDSTHGQVNWDISGPREPVINGAAIGANVRWYPSYESREDLGGKIVPVNPLFGVWWGNRDATGKTWPLFGREIAAAWNTVRDQMTDANGDLYIEVNTPDEISLMLHALETTLQGGRFSHIHPVFVKGDRAWEFDDQGNLKGTYDPELCVREAFSVSHNVAAAGEAWGSGGCTDCHSRNATFFTRPVLIDPFDTAGREVTIPVHNILGISSFTFSLFSLHFAFVRPWVWVLAIAALFAITLHFTRFGPHEFRGEAIMPRKDDHEMLERFSWFERTIHLTVLVTFLFLAFTGFAFAVSGGGQWLELFFQSLVRPRLWHSYLGLLFTVGLIGMTVLWWRDAVLERVDIVWLKELGGYLGGHQPVSSDRFNAGQKIFFWTVLAGGFTLAITGIVLLFKSRLPINVVMVAVVLHDLAAFLGIASVLAHIYLGTLANPGTLPAIFVGRVSRLWARLNHPLWYEKLTGKPALGGANKKPQENPED